MNIEDLKNAHHSYYCNEDNYYSNDCNFKFETFTDFMEEAGDCDADYNLLFRWDVKNKTDEEGEEIKDEYCLYLFWIQQRKGRFVINEVLNFTQQDVESFIKFVEPRFEHLKSLWEPLK